MIQQHFPHQCLGSELGDPAFLIVDRRQHAYGLCQIYFNLLVDIRLRCTLILTGIAGRQTLVYEQWNISKHAHQLEIVIGPQEIHFTIEGVLAREIKTRLILMEIIGAVDALVA